MGNKPGCFSSQGCCFLPSADGRKKLNGHEDPYIRHGTHVDDQPEIVIRPASFSNLQHISEREPEGNVIQNSIWQ